ncbi:MAG: hypothetical protein K6A65_01740 [Succinivibrionaceae bacterium]|nr:hypothetical protein [Succinivibrionaceae bacterium]
MSYCRLHSHNGVVGEGVAFERIRRVTGYLVGTLDRFNNAKRAEERDRVKHLHLGSGFEVVRGEAAVTAAPETKGHAA